MTQTEMLGKLKDNKQQADQFNAVAVFINEAIKKEMPTFMKLVQFDVLAEIQKKAASDNLQNCNTAEKQLTETLDQILGQINKDLEAQIDKKLAALKQ